MTLSPLRFLPRPADYSGLRGSWLRDLAAGVTVGIVALPLALAFGVATGVGAGPGLVTAVIAGAVAAIFGGSRLQVTGPTGAMTVVLVPLVAAHGPSVIYPIAILAGVLLMLAGLLRLGRLLDFIPWPLVEGFTVGIAIVIAAQELPSALGIAKPHIENAAGAAAVAVYRFAAHPQWPVLGLLALTVGITAFLPRLHRALPASLVAVVVTTAVAGIVGLRVDRIGVIPSGLPVPALPNFADVGTLVAPAMVVAFLAALESLLSAKVADGMSDSPNYESDRELFGQGLANIASGLGGGMPATGAIARTAVNARAGANTRLAALTHALVLAAIIYLASGLVGRIPLVALAGVLLVTAYRMIERRNVKAVLLSTRGDAGVFAVTAICTVAFNLITAVGVGLVLAAVTALIRISSTAQAIPESLDRDHISTDAEHELLTEHVLVYRLDGPLFFPVAARFLSELTAMADVQVVILRLSSLAILDASGARTLGEIVDQLADRNIMVFLKGASAEHTRLLAAVGTLAPLLHRGHVFTDLPTALAHAAEHVRLKRHHESFDRSRLLIIGPQGAGKGIQAQLLCRELRIPHISTGDIFRANADSGTALGLSAQSDMSADELVPDEVTGAMIAGRLAASDVELGFLLDGFPRTLPQAKWLTDWLKSRDQTIDAVLLIDAPDDVLLQRMIARQREDDTSDAIARRLALYHLETKPVLDHYRDLLVPVDGVGTVDEVHRRVMTALEQLSSIAVPAVTS